MAEMTQYTFTTCKSIGNRGPDQTQVNASYLNTSLTGQVTATGNGIQKWVVPKTGNYTIEARGAQGGYVGKKRGGKGAVIRGKFNLTRGQVLYILVGQMGLGKYLDGDGGSGGGGGTFVVDYSKPTTPVPLIVAGGGAGAPDNQTPNPDYTIMGASADTSGKTSSSNKLGGTNGSGGEAEGTNGGGGGYSGAGGGTSGVYSGASFLAGGLGATGYASLNGGFGGGAGGYDGGGAGGGYSGGGAANVGSSGGGGSYSATSTSLNIGDTHVGAGLVRITEGVYSTKDRYTFTTCGEYGRLGPTQAKVDNEYVGTPLAGKVTSEGGIQVWTVPKKGKYRIEAAGAQGGNTLQGYLGGKGAFMSGTFDLVAGQKLRILVGQTSALNHSSVYASPGGGGTFVAFNQLPLIVAGGGSGTTNGGAGADALVTNKGHANGGTNAASGAGFSGNGIGDSWTSASSSFLNGGLGGTQGSYTVENTGGFGGGASTHGNTGTGYPGGGGYNGGNQAEGGGSYNLGADQFNIAGFNHAGGYVNISLIEPLYARYLIEDGEEVKTYLKDTWSVVGEAPATREMFITSGMESVSIPATAVQQLAEDRPRLLKWEYDDIDYYTNLDRAPINVVKPTDFGNIVRGEGFAFGEGFVPGDGSFMKFVFSESNTIDRLAISCSDNPFDYSLKDIKLIFSDDTEVTVTLPNDKTWKAPNVLFVEIPKVSTASIKVVPLNYWEDALVGKTNVTIELLHFFKQDEVVYDFSIKPKDEWLPWDSVVYDNAKELLLPVFDISLKSSGTNHSLNGVPSDYFIITNLQVMLRGTLYTANGRIMARSSTIFTKTFRYAPYGVPYIDKLTLPDKLEFTHGEQVEFNYKTKHQQAQQDIPYKLKVKNVTKDEVVQDWVDLLDYGHTQFDVSFLESDHLINGDNILRIYLEDEVGHTSYEDIKIRKYASNGVSTMNLGVRYATKGLEWDILQPAGTDARMLFSKDGTTWLRYNLATDLWEEVDPVDIATEGLYLDEVSVLSKDEWIFFEGEELHLMIYLSTTDPWVEPKFNSIRVNYDSLAQVRYFFNVDDRTDEWYMFNVVSGKWVLIHSALEEAYRTHRGNTTEEVKNLNPSQWADFPLGDKMSVGMLLYTNDKTRTPIIRSLTLSDIHKASTPIESGELRLFDGYYYSPTLSMDYMCQWEKIEYNITANAVQHFHSVEVRTHTGQDWTEWAAVTPTTAVELGSVIPEGYKLQFRVYFSTVDKITSPKLLPTVKITYRISSKEILDANVQKMAEDLKQTKVSLANMEFKHHSTAAAQRYNLNNIVIENFNDSSEVAVELNADFTGTSYKLEDPTMPGEIRLSPIKLPWFADYVMIHANYQGDIEFEVSYDGIEYAPLELHEKRFTAEGVTEVYVRIKMLTDGPTEPEIDFISVMF